MLSVRLQPSQEFYGAVTELALSKADVHLTSLPIPIFMCLWYRHATLANDLADGPSPYFYNGRLLSSGTLCRHHLPTRTLARTRRNGRPGGAGSSAARPGLLGLAAAGAVGVALTIAVALAVAYPNLPDISDLADYRPKLPMRVYSVEGALLGEFGEERRNLTPIQDIPKVMTNAVLAIEDARFFQHGGVDYKGVVRAALANMGRVKSQGASTITMQVARNVYLSSEKHLPGKFTKYY